MKKLLLILLCLPMAVLSQKTYVPDDAFEQTLISLGYDSVLDDSVLTLNINTVTGLALSNSTIIDLTGIEDFLDLRTLSINYGSLSELDLSHNINLIEVNIQNSLNKVNLSNTKIKNVTKTLGYDSCAYIPYVDTLILNNMTELELVNQWQCGVRWLELNNNPNLIFLGMDQNPLDSINVNNLPFLEGLVVSNCSLSNINVTNNLNLKYLNIGNYVNGYISNIDLSNNLNLEIFSCEKQLLTYLELSNNTLLTNLNCNNNLLTCLDLSINTSLIELYCKNNLLDHLNTQNGNWQNMDVDARSNNLNCVEVDNIGYATNNWNFDSFTTLSTNCNYITTCNSVSGCTDSIACNYDSTATISDSSCVYLNDSVIITSPSCYGISNGSVSVSISGGSFPYQYSLNGNPSQSIGIFTNLSAGTYSLVVTDTNGCTSTQTFTITEPNPLNVSIYILDPLLCYGDSIASVVAIPDGGTLPYSFNWTSGQITDTVSNLSVGTYTVFVVDNNGCSDFTTVSINSPSAIISNNNLNGCDSVLVGSNYYSISGVYTDTLASVNGCDSIVNTNLTLGQNTASYDTLSVVASIVWNGMPLSVSGDYSVILVNSVGCDSIVNLNLTITTTGISDLANNKTNLIKITDILGKEIPNRKNTTLFYIYDDGTVEKRIVIE